MTTMKLCLEAVKSLSDADVASLADRIEAYRAQGLGDRDSEVAAVEDMLAEVDAEQAQMGDLLRAQHPDLFRVQEEARPPAPAPATPKPSKQKARAKPAPSANTVFTEDAAEKARALLRKKLGQVSSGIDPEVLQAGITLSGYHIERGARTFAAYAQAMLADMGDLVRPYLKSWYLATKYDPRMAGTDGLSPASEVESTDVATIDAADNAQPEPADVPDPNPNLERDRSDAGTADAAVATPVQGGAGPTAAGAGSAGGRAGEAGRRRSGDPGLPADGAAAAGEPGDQPVPGRDRQERPAEFAARTGDGQRSDDPGVPGIPPDHIAADQTARAADSRSADLKKRAAQRAAEAIAVKPGDLANIRETLPYLLPEQQEDVHKAEQRFSQADGYGMLFTNGTGTGKTFTGLGIVKRFERQGKTNTLIVVPDGKIMADWVDSARALGLTVTPLEDTKDAGRGISITTYANLGENDALARRDWDLIVPDEAHSLKQSADGKDTLALNALRAISLHPRGIYDRHAMLHRKELARQRELSEQIDGNTKILNNPDTMDQMLASVRAQNKKLQAEADALAAKLSADLEREKADVMARQGDRRTRVAALSATPFAYEKTVDWAEGYLFDYKDGFTGDETSLGYNDPGAYDSFFIQHFGYRMRVNKLTEPDANVDRGLMQRQFNGWLKKRGVLAGRQLEVAADYDRRFILVDSAAGNAIDNALQWVEERAQEDREAKRKANAEQSFSPWSALQDELRDHFYGPQGHLVRRYLLEAIKAKEVIPHIREHLALGRKVVVFHDFKKGGAVNPFDFRQRVVAPLPPGAGPHDREDHAKRQEQAAAVNVAIGQFRKQFPDLADGALLQDLVSPIQRFTREFPDVLLINGNEKPADLLDRYRRFNDDEAGPIVALVQSAKNKGWSGHDTTGKHQRVLFNLGLPTQPTMTIQQEGRIYRTGQVSDALFRYLNTGTNWERWAFASTIAERASAAENLGSGELARALKDAFIAGFEESGNFRAGDQDEGKGGKERDRLANTAVTEYDRAKSFYWGTQKKDSRTKAREGTDYFATPEPLGLKMVQWADGRGGEDALEPSGGHGAIARWFGETMKRTAIEPSTALASRMALVFDGKIVQADFESHNVVNKYDIIAMNPPFGTAGRTAIDHLAKAATHLREGGRIVALIPEGPAADKKFDAWFYEENKRPSKPLYTDPKLGPIHAGDVLISGEALNGLKLIVGHVDKHKDGRLTARPLGEPVKSGVWLNFIEKVQAGPRTETHRPAEGLHLVAQVHLPSVTFERAATSVRTRVVIIEKAIGDQPTPRRGDIDLTDIDEIKVLFDRLEDLEMPPRARPEADALPAEVRRAFGKGGGTPIFTPADAAPAPKLDGAAGRWQAMTREQREAAAMAAGLPRAAGQLEAWADLSDNARARIEASLPAGPEIVEHTTGKGKVIRGVVRTDLSLAQAKEIDPYTFKKDGGLFIREKYLKPDAPQLSRAPDQPADLRRGAGAGLQPAFLNSLLDQLREDGTITADVRVAATVADMPLAQRNALLAKAPDGRARGAYFRRSDEVWLVAENLHTPQQAVFVLLHEAFHRGLHVTLGEKGAQLLRQIYATNAKVRDLADANMREFKIGKEEATNEALADLAGLGEVQKLNGWGKLVRMIRDWLRRVGEVVGFELAYTDKEIAGLVAKLRKAGLQGGVSVDSAPADLALASRGGRDAARWSARAENAEGPEFYGNGIGLISIQRMSADEFAPNGVHMGHGVSVREGHTVHRFLVTNDAAEVLGLAVLEVDQSGNVEAVHDIEINDRRAGAGRRVMESILASAPGPVRIIDILEQSQAFWDRMGAGYRDPYGNTTATWSSYQAENSRGNARGRQGAGQELEADPRPAGAAQGSEEEDSPLLSRYSPQEREALQRAGIAPRRRLGDHLRRAWSAAAGLIAERGELAQGLRQGALDQFFGIRRAVERDIGNLPAEQDPYVTARLANGGTSSVMRALLLHGQAQWAANGQHLEKKPGTKGLLDILQPLGDDLNDWFGWMIGNRAARLKAEGRENNFTDAQIQALQGLATPAKRAAFQLAAIQYAAFKRSVLDMAQAAGLINPETRPAWDNADYIPFYRQIDERASFSPTGRKGLAGQSSGIRTLRGGEAALNDPIENLLMNFSRLVDASLKNNAISRTIRVLEEGGSFAVEKVGYSWTQQVVPRAQIERQLIDAGTPQQILAVMPPEAFDGMAKMWAIQAPSDPDVIRVMRDGKPEFYKVHDPLLLKAATSFVPFDFPGLGLMRMFKRVLTSAVTATPEFMARNYIRDSLAVQGIARTGVNPAKSVSGIVKAFAESGAAEHMLFAGASFQSGNVNAADPTGTATAVRRALRQKGMDATSADRFLATVVDKPVRLWELYRKAGEAVENANREAVFEATEKAGGSVTEAAFEAKDLMDFSLRGSHPIYQLAADVLPFFNARVQGLYRLGRSDPKRVAVYGALMAAVSVALVLANSGEDWYDELPDWDKDTYWHFKVAGQHFRIPKPFELGVAFATIPERIARFLGGQDSASKAGSRLWANIRDQLAFDPIPQAIRPAANVWANKDTFRDTKIESLGDEQKLSHLRYGPRTSATAKTILAGTAPATDAVGLSPKKLEYLVGGYFGTAGLYALGLSDMAVRALEGYPPQPAPRVDDLPVVRAFVRADPARSTVFESDLYKIREHVDAVYRSVKALEKEGQADKAKALADANPKEMAAHAAVDRGARDLARLRRERDAIYKDLTMTPAQKRLALDRLQVQQNAIAKQVMREPAVKALQ